MESADPRAEPLLNAFLNALLLADEAACLKALLPLVHKSLLNKMGDALSRDVQEFSFKKARTNAKNYAQPVRITEVRANRVSAIGFGPSAQSGTETKYWIAKREGVGGMPAPVNIFFPADGGPPLISYMGSL